MSSRSCGCSLCAARGILRRDGASQGVYGGEDVAAGEVDGDVRRSRSCWRSLGGSWWGAGGNWRGCTRECRTV